MTRTGLVLCCTLVVSLGACGGEDARPTQAQATRHPVFVARDAKAGTTFRLDGPRLRIEVADRELRRSLAARGTDVFCGTTAEFGPFGASAKKRRIVARDDRSVTYELSRDLGKKAGFCGAEGDFPETFGFFVSQQRLLQDTLRAADRRKER